GHPVMAEGGGQIVFGPGETDVVITPEGAISSSAGAKGTLRIVEFENPQALTRAGETLFAGGEPMKAQSTSVIQGAVEHSNVSAIAEMSEMIRVTRAYASLADLMTRQDEMRRDAIQRLGNTSA